MLATEQTNNKQTQNNAKMSQPQSEESVPVVVQVEDEVLNTTSLDDDSSKRRRRLSSTKVTASEQNLSKSNGQNVEDMLAGEGEDLPFRRNFFSIMKYYAIDWITPVILISMIFIFQNLPKRDRFYLENDPQFSYPYQPNTVSTPVYVLLGGVLPFICAIIMQIVLSRAVERWNWHLDLHHFVLGLFQSFAIAELCTIALKVSVGRLRPSAFARQKLDVNGWDLSYPSGHTSFMFTGMVYLSLYLCGKTGVFSSGGIFGRSRNGDPYRGSFSLLILTFIIPLGIAVFVMASRLVDYAHDFADVNAGAMIGLVVAAVCYHINFLPVTATMSALARPLALVHTQVLIDSNPRLHKRLGVVGITQYNDSELESTCSGVRPGLV